MSIVLALAACTAPPPDSLLLAAARQGDTDQVRALLAKGANPNAANTDGNTLTALMLASRGGYSAAVRLLLDAGAKADATAAVSVGATGVNEGLTALMEAAESDDGPTVQLLLDHKADPNAKATFQMTGADGKLRPAGSRPVLMHATSVAVLQLLADHGANLAVTDDDGNSVLMYAAENLDAPAVQYLLSKGLDSRARNRNGKAALELARIAGRTENAAILEKASH